jgi:hypothetical protein
MIQRPSAVPLVLCKDVLIEHNSQRPSLIRCFHKLTSRSFPTGARPFWVYTVLTDGIGIVRFSLRITRLDTMEEVYKRSWQAEFANPLQKLYLRVRISTCSFPVPTRYVIALYADEESIAEIVLPVVEENADG